MKPKGQKWVPFLWGEAVSSRRGNSVLSRVEITPQSEPALSDQNTVYLFLSFFLSLRHYNRPMPEDIQMLFLVFCGNPDIQTLKIFFALYGYLMKTDSRVFNKKALSSVYSMFVRFVSLLHVSTWH